MFTGRQTQSMRQQAAAKAQAQVAAKTKEKMQQQFVQETAQKTAQTAKRTAKGFVWLKMQSFVPDKQWHGRRWDFWAVPARSLR